MLKAKCRFLHPFQGAFFPDPDVTHDQNGKEDQHLNQSKHASRLELHRPGEQEDGLHIEHHEQDGDNIVTDGVTASRVIDGIDAALVRHQLFFARIFRPHQFGSQQGDWNQNPDQRDEYEDGNLILWHQLPQDISLLTFQKTV